MVNFLESPHKYFGKFGLTNWNVICVYWGDDNPQYAIDPEFPMPDYKNMLN